MCGIIVSPLDAIEVSHAPLHMEKVGYDQGGPAG
jgi:hypothetical protein